MSTNPKPESTPTEPEKTSSTGDMLKPAFYSRLYPKGWDLSELCKPQEASKPSENQAEDPNPFRLA